MGRGSEVEKGWHSTSKRSSKTGGPEAVGYEETSKTMSAHLGPRSQLWRQQFVEQEEKSKQGPDPVTRMRAQGLGMGEQQHGHCSQKMYQG